MCEGKACPTYWLNIPLVKNESRQAGTQAFLFFVFFPLSVSCSLNVYLAREAVDHLANFIHHLQMCIRVVMSKHLQYDNCRGRNAKSMKTHCSNTLDTGSLRQCVDSVRYLFINQAFSVVCGDR